MLLAKAAQLTWADGHVAHRRQPRAQLTVLASGSSIEPQTATNRRSCLAAGLAVALASGTAAAHPQAAEAAAAPPAAPAGAQRLTYFADTFTTTTTGLRYLDIKVGEGTAPEPGDTCVVNWAGYTKGYQGKRFGNSSIEDREPFEFVLGSQQAIPAIEEAVAGMRAGGLRRIEIPGSIPELGYPLARNVRFTNEVSLYSDKIYKYRFGPQPQDFFGQRALDFVLDNPTLQDFNRDLLIDIKLLAVRKAKS